VFNNAIDCRDYAFSEAIRQKYRKNLCLEGSFVLGHVGRFNEQKNHKYLIKIFALYSQIIPDAKLLLVGEGPLKDSIKELVAELKLTDKVIFLGQRDDVNNILMAMDVFLLPSLYEGLPVVGIEAQASGLPCIMSETITKEVAIADVYFESIDAEPKAWVSKLLDINPNDIAKRTNAYKIVGSKGYDIDKEAEKLYKLYKSFEEDINANQNLSSLSD